MSCEPQIDDKIDLGLPPSSVSFEVIQGDTPNDFTFVDNTEGTFISQWNFGNNGTAEGREVSAYYPSAGDYEVTLTAFNEGGHAKGSKTITVTEDAPVECENLVEYLTECGSIEWNLIPTEGALWVGPEYDQSTTWWQNDENVVTERFCTFDDAYIFSEDGTFEYDTKGDLWSEDYMGAGTGCVADADLTGTAAPWASGVHSFVVLNDNQIQVNGLGAFIGLPKAINGAELTGPTPASSITYDVVSMGEYEGKKTIKVGVQMGAGWWFFHLVQA